MLLYESVVFTDNYDWCIVPDTGYDVILLAGIAVVVACICQGRLSNLMVLVAGECPVHLESDSDGLPVNINYCKYRWNAARCAVPMESGTSEQLCCIMAQHRAI